jgi:hypothetical protein
VKQRKLTLFFALIAGIFLALFIYKQTLTTSSKAGSNRNGKEVFNRLNPSLVFSKHARCRMACRHVDEEEIKELLKSGTINERKIEKSSRGTTYPIEGISRDGQLLRVVVAPHNEKIVVVTVIDLRQEWSCDCH